MRWDDDSPPELSSFVSIGVKFGYVRTSGVWFRITPSNSRSIDKAMIEWKKKKKKKVSGSPRQWSSRG